MFRNVDSNVAMLWVDQVSVPVNRTENVCVHPSCDPTLFRTLFLKINVASSHHGRSNARAVMQQFFALDLHAPVGEVVVCLSRRYEMDGTTRWGRTLATMASRRL